MNVNVRRFIAVAFIVAFLICAPLLIIYTAGYRYNFKKNQVQKTGALIVETEPRNANVQINNKLAKGKTPLRLNNVLPDQYQITIQKEGYYPWQKQIAINSQETTFIEDILLFPQAEPEKITDYQINWVSFSPQHSFAVFSATEFNQDYLYLLNLNNNKTKLLFNDNQAFEEPAVIWAPDDSKLLFQTNGATILATTSFPQQTSNLSAEVKEYSWTKFKWHPTDKNQLLGQNNNKIYEFNLMDNNVSLIFELEENKLIDFYILNNEIFTIEELTQKTILTKYSLTNESVQTPKIIELNNNNYSFEQTYQDKLGLRDQQNDIYYLTNTGLDRILFHKNNLISADQHLKENLLLLQTSQELSSLDLDLPELKEQTITRYSQGLKQAQWHNQSTNYALTLQDNKIYIIELDERDGHFTLTLPIENVETFNLDSKAKQIIFLKDKTLWALDLEK